MVSLGPWTRCPPSDWALAPSPSRPSSPHSPTASAPPPRHQDTYNAEDDAFPIAYLLLPALVLGVAVNQVGARPRALYNKPRVNPRSARGPVPYTTNPGFLVGSGVLLGSLLTPWRCPAHRGPPPRFVGFTLPRDPTPPATKPPDN